MQAEMKTFMKALEELDRALDDDIERTHRMKARIREIQEARADGRPLTEVVSKERPPLIVQQLTDSSEMLHSYGTRLRKAEARALRSEGMTMDEIASVFGVSRQRISALLREGKPAGRSKRRRP
jgi:hypothetical protein